jgi:hypothetical protein
MRIAHLGDSGVATWGILGRDWFQVGLAAERIAETDSAGQETARRLQPLDADGCLLGLDVPRSDLSQARQPSVDDFQCWTFSGPTA